jgi:membrane fusion protein (multidrug efflux system)
MTVFNSSHRIEVGAGVLAFAAGSLLGLASACSSPAEAKERSAIAPISVETTLVEARSLPRTVALTGTLVANREAEVASDAAGRVLATFVERGDVVPAGAPLARLDARAARLGNAEAAAMAASLRAEEEHAKLECARAERLFAENAISRAERDRAATACAASTHSLAAADARAGLAQKGLSDATVRAPFSGEIVERRVDIGEYVAPGHTIATLVETRVLRVELAVPESATASVKVGGSVTFGVAAYPGREFTGVLLRLSPKLRTQSRDQLVEVEVDNTSGALRPGMFVTADLTVGERTVPSVPVSAVSGRAPAERAFVVKNGRVEERIVATSTRRGDRVFVTKGLAAGEAVVLRPSERVRDGVFVK